MNNIDICLEISQICESCGELDWSRVFIMFENDLKYRDYNVVKREILRLYGGMGSFNDLVLSKNGSVLTRENDRLRQLRKALYDNITTNW